MNYLAVYKGPAEGLRSKIFHWGVCTWTRSKYSHCEIVIGDWCYSSSSRDGGVRKKQIDLTSGKWDLIPLPNLDVNFVLEFYENTKDHRYDYFGLGWFVTRISRHSVNAWFCSEWCGTAQKFAGTHKLHIQDLADQANYALRGVAY